MNQTVNLKNSENTPGICCVEFSLDKTSTVNNYNVSRYQNVIKKYNSITFSVVFIGIIGFLIVTTIFLTSFITDSFDVEPHESPHHSKLFIGDANQIRIYNLKTNKSSLWHEVTENIVTFDVTNSSVFYIERSLAMVQSIHVSRLLNSTLLTKKIHPQAMAVDFLTKNLYVLDKSARTVNVMDFEGKNFGIMLSDLEELHDIILDIEQGLMFLVQYKKSILRANMDGSNLQEIVKDKNISAMTLDRERKKIFWADDNSGITTANYNGKNRIVLIESHYATIKSLSFHENNLYWLHPLGRRKRVTPWTCRIENDVCGNKQELLVLLHDPQIIKTFIDFNFTENPCKINNGNCSDLCLLTSKKQRTCACKTGYQLDSDLKNCTPVDDFILYLTKNFIRGISLNSKQGDTFKDIIAPTFFKPNSTSKEIISFDYDVKNDDFYYCEGIYVKTFKIKSESEPSIMFEFQSGCRGLTFDWRSKNFYCIENNFLIIFRRGGENIFVKEIENTYGITHFTADFERGVIYFKTDSEDSNLYLLNIDGLNLKVLAAGESFRNSKELAVDFDNNIIYFIKDQTLLSIHLIYLLDIEFMYDSRNAISFRVYKKQIFMYNSTTIWQVIKKKLPRSDQIVSKIIINSQKEKMNNIKIFSTSSAYSNTIDNQCEKIDHYCEQFCFSRPVTTCGCGDGFKAKYRFCIPNWF